MENQGNPEYPELIVHGNAPEEVKEEIRNDRNEAREKGYSPELSEEEVAELLKAEIPKTPIDLEAIDLSNACIDELTAEYGLESKLFDVDEKHVHILPEDVYKKIVGEEWVDNPACFLSSHRALFVRYYENVPAVARVSTILHEAVHTKQFTSEQAFDFKDGKFRDLYRGPFRGGLQVYSNMKSDHEIASESGVEFDFLNKFVGLNEAIVTKIEQKLLPLIVARSIDIPKEPFTHEEAKADVAEQLKVPVSEIEMTDENGTAVFGYIGPRQTLDYVIDSIVEDDSSLTKETVTDIFFKAHFSGNLLEIGRLVEGTFGKGSFRILGDMESTDESAKEIKDLLSERRKESMMRESIVLESIKTFPPSAYVELIEMIEGVRPVAEVTVIAEFRDTMLPVIKMLQQQGFIVEGYEKTSEITEFYVSKDAVLAKEAAANHDTEPRRFGELMGFPKTAVEAFLLGNGNMIDPRKVDDLLGFKNYCFPFRLSKEHYTEEIEYLRKSYRVLLEKAPDAIDRMLPTGEDPEEYRKKVKTFVGVL